MMRNKSIHKKRTKQYTPKHIVDTLGNGIAWIFVVIISISCVCYFFSDTYMGRPKTVMETVGVGLLFTMTVAGAVVFVIMSWRKSKGKSPKANKKSL